MGEPKNTSDIRLRQAVMTLVAWLVATLLVGRWLRQGEIASVADLIAMLSQGVAWNVVLGLAVVAFATRLFGWSDLGFQRPGLRLSLRLMWFPILLLIPIFALAFALGLPPASSVAFLAVNTILVAVSEEWMFRGILFRVLTGRHRIWSAVLLTSFVFGSVHVLNGFTYGDLSQSSAQAVAAMMTGLLLCAFVVRTGSIWPAIVFHTIWNFGLLLATYEAAQQPLPETRLSIGAYFLPLLIVLPNLLCAVFLLRKVRNLPG